MIVANGNVAGLLALKEYWTAIFKTRHKGSLFARY